MIATVLSQIWEQCPLLEARAQSFSGNRLLDHKRRLPRQCNSMGYYCRSVGFGFKTILTSQVISVAFYSEREKSNKFCSVALISA